MVSLSGCFPYINSNIINGFTSKNEYFDNESFMDYTDYAKYTYASKKSFEKSNTYKLVTAADVEELREFFENYSKWIEYRKGYEEWFDFDYKTQVKENDYFILKIKDPNGSSGKFESYDIYYFDTQTLTLYYFHSNS